MSVDKKIMGKKSDKFSKMNILDPDNFRKYALDQWDLVAKKELIVTAPKGYESR